MAGGSINHNWTLKAYQATNAETDPATHTVEYEWTNVDPGEDLPEGRQTMVIQLGAGDYQAIQSIIAPYIQAQLESEATS